jgi:hypothetical protein
VPNQRVLLTDSSVTWLNAEIEQHQANICQRFAKLLALLKFV